MKSFFLTIAALLLTVSASSFAVTTTFGTGGTIEYPNGTKWSCPNPSSAICAVSSRAMYADPQFPDQVQVATTSGFVEYQCLILDNVQPTGIVYFPKP